MKNLIKLSAITAITTLSAVGYSAGNKETSNTATSTKSGYTTNAGQDTSVIRSAQEALRREGYTVTVDGVVGPSTTKAIRDFQKEESLEQTGTLTNETLSALNVIQGRQPSSIDDFTDSHPGATDTNSGATQE